jgi:hypothetical protein
LHKYEIVKRISGGDYPEYVEKCKRCDKTVIATYKALGNPFVINRSDLDESENVIIDEDRVNDLWDRCLKSNSYTHMGSEIRFDKIADMVIGEKQWHMRDQALLTIKAMGKLLTPEKKLEILKVSGVSKGEIDNCYGEE